MKINIKFVNGRIHKIESRGGLWSFLHLRTLLSGNIKLKCGLVAKEIFGFGRQWCFTFNEVDCENCLRKIAVAKPTDLSNYHTFVD